MWMRKVEVANKRKAAPKRPALPAGMTAIEHAESWNPVNVGDDIHFRTSAPIKTVPFRDGARRVVEVTTMDGEVLALWENAALRKLFETINAHGVGGEYYVRYDGLGEAKMPDQSPPKLFTVAGKGDNSSQTPF